MSAPTPVGSFVRSHGKFEWRDAAGLHTIEWRPGEGNVSISGLEAGQREAIALMDRDNFAEHVEGGYIPVELSITVRHTGKLTNAVDPVVLDSLLQTGAYANDVTADPGGVVWTGHGKFTATRNGVSTGFNFYNGRPKVAYAEAKEGNTLSITATFHGLPDSDLLPAVPF